MLQPSDLCYCWQQGWADFAFTARYNLFNGPVALTTSISYGLPSHDYAYVGEAVVGRNLRELRAAVDAGLRLDAISPRLAVQGRYSYAWVQQVLDVPNDRSNITAEALYGLTGKLQIRGGVSRQITHGGLRLGTQGPTLPSGYPWGEATTPELFAEHDRLLRDNYWHLRCRSHLQLLQDRRVRVLRRVRRRQRHPRRPRLHRRPQRPVRATTALNPREVDVAGIRLWPDRDGFSRPP